MSSRHFGGGGKGWFTDTHATQARRSAVLLRSIRARGLGNMRAHEYCHTRFNKYGAMLALPLMVLSSITSTMAVTAVGESSSVASGVGSINRSRGFGAAMAVLSTVIAVLTGMQSYFKLDARARDHLNTSRQLQGALSIIDQELTFGAMGDASDPAATLQRTVLQFNNIYKLAPMIPYDVIDLYPSIRAPGSAMSIVEDASGEGSVFAADARRRKASMRKERRHRHRVEAHSQGVTTAALVDMRSTPDRELAAPREPREMRRALVPRPSPAQIPPAIEPQRSHSECDSESMGDDDDALVQEAGSAYQEGMTFEDPVFQWTPLAGRRSVPAAGARQQRAQQTSVRVCDVLGAGWGGGTNSIPNHTPQSTQAQYK